MRREIENVLSLPSLLFHNLYSSVSSRFSQRFRLRAGRKERERWRERETIAAECGKGEGRGDIDFAATHKPAAVAFHSLPDVARRTFDVLRRAPLKSWRESLGRKGQTKAKAFDKPRPSTADLITSEVLGFIEVYRSANTRPDHLDDCEYMPVFISLHITYRIISLSLLIAIYLKKNLDIFKKKLFRKKEKIVIVKL